MVAELAPGEVMVRGGTLESPNGLFQLSLQDDGNLTLHRRVEGARPTWASGTDGAGGYEAAGDVPLTLTMQGDGNLVLAFHHDPPEQFDVLWSSGTAGHEGSRLVLQNDGNLVIYSPQGAPLWSPGIAVAESFTMNPGSDRLMVATSMRPGDSLVSANGRYRLQLQEDGNLVVVRAADGGALWASNTEGNAVTSGGVVTQPLLTLQGDGNLVLHLGTVGQPADGQVLWASGTQHGAVLVMQDDGNAVLYDGFSRVLWATGTNENG